MPDRYIAHDYDAAWQVWDNVERRSVGGSFTEAGALAEAARLNKAVPQRLLPTEAWVLLHGNHVKAMSQHRHEVSHLPWAADLHGYRIARVRITEIEGGDSHG